MASSHRPRSGEDLGHLDVGLSLIASRLAQCDRALNVGQGLFVLALRSEFLRQVKGAAANLPIDLTTLVAPNQRSVFLIVK